MKVIFPIIAASFVLAGCQTTNAQNKVTQPFEEFARQEAKFAYDPQYERYASYIATPLRDFKVYDEFSLVDDSDWTSFKEYHQKYLQGNWDDSRGETDWNLRTKIDHPEKCEDSLKNFNTSAGKKENKKEIIKVTAGCKNILFQRFYNDQEKGIQPLANILLHWEEQNILTDIKTLNKKIRTKNYNGRNYAVMSTVGQMMGHYSLYHRMYNFTEQQHRKIDIMFTTFVTEYSYYKEFAKRGPAFANVCDLKNKTSAVRKGIINDHCGSWNLRIATGATLYGMEFANQTVYDFGIRRLEVTLATFDQKGGYSAQMTRGMMALGYARQFIGPFDQLEYAFKKSFNFDFANMKLVHGKTPNEAYVTLYEYAHNPVLFAHYPVLDNRGGDFRKAMALLKKGKGNYRMVWESFNLRDFYIIAPKFAKDNFPKKSRFFFWDNPERMRYAACCNNLATQIQVGHVVGFNPYILRDATNTW